MSISDDEDDCLAQFLETNLSEISDQENDDDDDDDYDAKEPSPKRIYLMTDLNESKRIDEASSSSSSSAAIASSRNTVVGIDTGIFSKIPPELFRHILKFLSSEDLIACLLVCRFLNQAASDESLWQRLYRMRWGVLAPTRKLRERPWKNLYIQRDEEDTVDLGRNCPVEFKEYYLQMQAAKRSQAPLPSQVKVNEDGLILDKTVSDQVSIWKRSKGLTDKAVADHTCSGEKCTYYQVEDVFVCEKTGQVHVCDEFCREAVMDPANMLWACRISGHCFDNVMSPQVAESDAASEIFLYLLISINFPHVLNHMNLECNFSGVRTKEVRAITLYGKNVQGSDFFRYLGSIIQKDGELDVDVAHRIKAGWLKWKSAT